MTLSMPNSTSNKACSKSSVNEKHSYYDSAVCMAGAPILIRSCVAMTSESTKASPLTKD